LDDPLTTTFAAGPSIRVLPTLFAESSAPALDPPIDPRHEPRLFHPLRLALTGQDKGPEMAKLLPLIGKTRAEARLRGNTA
jgi:glutamyl-tRNA synthetase